MSTQSLPHLGVEDQPTPKRQDGACFLVASVALALVLTGLMLFNPWVLLAGGVPSIACFFLGVYR